MARRHSSSSRPPTDRLVGASPAINGLRQHILHLAAFDTVGNPHVPTLLLHGETGTGKGLIARVIHDSGPRAPGPFVEVNCAAIPETMLEAELFGFEAGAFTDAKRGKPGLFEAAAGGTLFLDEVDALSLALQSKLLTAVEEKRVRRLGGVVSQAVDIKLIAATQVDLSAAAQAGRFRADLYHRLAVILLEVPPLRERGADVVLLAQHLLQQFATAHRLPVKQLSAAAAAWLQRYPWPGNIRELRHLMERITLLCRDAVIEPAMLAQWSLSGSPMVTVSAPQPVAAEMGSLDEPARMREALRHTGGNVSRAAKLLGWSRKALRYRLQRYGIEPHTTVVAPAAQSHDMASSLIGERPSSGLVPTPVAALPEPRPQSTTPPHDLPPASGWEQRTVAVLAIDLTLSRTGGLALSAAAFWEVLQRWEEAIAEEIQACGGVLLRRSPPLLVAAFGLPQALEQMPHRAVHAALTIQRRLEHERLTAGPEVRLELRQAVHLGPVLVDRAAPDPIMRLPAVGETLAVPMRLLGHTAPGEILASPQAARLLEVAFAVQARELPLGTEHPAPLTAYAVTGHRPRPALPEDLTARPRSPFVGRERELALLHELLSEVEQGRGQVVGIMGEPGMGKSRLLREFRRSLSRRQIRYLEGHCLAYAQAIPYFPVLDVLRQQAEITEGDRPSVVGDKVRRCIQAVGMDLQVGAPPLFRLLGLKEGPEPLASLTPQALRPRTFEALGHCLFGIDQQPPLLLAIEDLHWIDQTSAAFLAAWIERLSGLRVMVLCTYRPGYQPPWLHKSYATQLSLKPLSRQDSQRVLQSVLATAALSEALAQTILRKAEGNPFFLEELAQSLTERGDCGADLELPDTLQGVLMARIDALPAASKRLLQTLAVVGKTCSLRLLSQVTGQPEDGLQELVWPLQKGEFIYEQPAMPKPLWGFKHILTQDVAYHSLALEQRRHLHGCVARALEVLLQDRVVEHYAELAQHYRHSGDTAQAVDYLQRAGQHASERSAHLEAISHYTTGLELLRTLPETSEHRQQALSLHLALGAALQMAKGMAAPEVEQAYTQAHRLCQQVGETPELVPVLFGLWRFYIARSQLHTARDLGETLRCLATGAPHPSFAVIAHYAIGLTGLYLGDLPAAHHHLEEALVRYTPDQRRALVFRMGQDPGVACRVYAAGALWGLGYPAQAVARIHQAVALAQELSHPYSLAHARAAAAFVSQYRRDVPTVYEQAEACVALATEQGFPLWAALGTSLRGWALALQGQGEEGLAQVRQGLAAFRDTGAALTVPYLCAVLAEVYDHLGYTEAGLQALAEANTLVEQQEQRLWAAEICRLRGVMLLRQPGTPVAEAETWLQRAVAVARRQQAKSLELRAAMSLSRLWQQQGKRHEARAALAPVYGWFTEGFDTADLQEAKALLDALA